MQNVSNQLFIFTIVTGIEKYSQIQITSPNDDIISTLQSIGIEVDHIHYVKNEILELAVSDSDIKKLENSQIPFVITIDDLTTYFQSRFTQPESRDFPAYPSGFTTGINQSCLLFTI